MANRTHILLLDHDEARRGTASAILDFLDEPHVALAALSEARGEPPQAVLLAADGEGFDLEAVLEALAARDPGLPVVITAVPAGGVAAGRLESMVIGTLGWPFAYARVVDALHRARVYREQYELGRARGQQHHEGRVGEQFSGLERGGHEEFLAGSGQPPMIAPPVRVAQLAPGGAVTGRVPPSDASPPG